MVLHLVFHGDDRHLLGQQRETRHFDRLIVWPVAGLAATE